MSQHVHCGESIGRGDAVNFVFLLDLMKMRCSAFLIYKTSHHLSTAISCKLAFLLSHLLDYFLFLIRAKDMS